MHDLLDFMGGPVLIAMPEPQYCQAKHASGYNILCCTDELTDVDKALLSKIMLAIKAELVPMNNNTAKYVLSFGQQADTSILGEHYYLPALSAIRLDAEIKRQTWDLLKKVFLS